MLSPDGRRRRDEMLVDLHARLDRRVARRRAVGAAGGTGVLAMLAVAWAWIAAPAPNPAPGPRPVATTSAARGNPAPEAAAPVLAAPSIEPASAPRIITVVASDPDVVRRLSSGVAAPGLISILTDDALQHELAAAGYDPGLVTIDGRTQVVAALGAGPTRQ